jgi:hypothetical protein
MCVFEFLSISTSSSADSADFAVEPKFSTAKIVMSDRRRGTMKQETRETEMWVYLRQNIDLTKGILILILILILFESLGQILASDMLQDEPL